MHINSLNPILIVKPHSYSAVLYSTAEYVLTCNTHILFQLILMVLLILLLSSALVTQLEDRVHTAMSSAAPHEKRASQPWHSDRTLTLVRSFVRRPCTLTFSPRSRSEFCRTSSCSRRSESARPVRGEPRGAGVVVEGGVSSTGPRDHTHSVSAASIVIRILWFQPRAGQIHPYAGLLQDLWNKNLACYWGSWVCLPPPPHLISLIHLFKTFWGKYSK